MNGQKRVRITIEANLSGKCGRERVAELANVANLSIRRHDSGPMRVHDGCVWWEDITREEGESDA